jgi:hypothetical protein
VGKRKVKRISLWSSFYPEEAPELGFLWKKKDPPGLCSQPGVGLWNIVERRGNVLCLKKNKERGSR